jgi:hypothetical protein
MHSASSVKVAFAETALDSRKLDTAIQQRAKQQLSNDMKFSKSRQQIINAMRRRK